MERVRDAQHAIRYNVLQARRLFRDEVKNELIPLFNAAVDLIHSTMRSILGAGVVLFTISANLCSQWKEKCHRKGDLQ